MGKYEVTQAQYEAVMMGVTGELNATPSNWPNNGVVNRPLDNVSYDDINIFLNRLNVLESNRIQNGWAYVLPTEAQWEYACRAGTSTSYSWGNSIGSNDANWDYGSDPNRPVDVGLFAPNNWGFHDMHGNVYEWVRDWYGAYPTSSVSDPVGVLNGTQKVIRGGAYGNGVVANLRAAFRYKNSTSLRSSGLGFRLAFVSAGKQPTGGKRDSVWFSKYKELFPALLMFGHLIKTVPRWRNIYYQWKWILLLKCPQGCRI